jgi:hypothetical protein
MKRALPLLIVALGCRPAPQAPKTIAPERAMITVSIVVDAMAAWIADERWGQLPADGGFARLLREGTYVREIRYAHAVTDTAPGHAAIYTGVTPRESGIVANELVREGKLIGVLRDDNTKSVDASGITTAVGSSIARLRVPTVADRLREAMPHATIVSLSIKDRGAIFGGGRRPNATIWFDATLDRFVTSTAFANTLPTWALPHGTTSTIEALRAKPWDLLDRKFVESHALAPDDHFGEGDWDGLGRTFPHDVAHATKPGSAMRATPYGDEAVFALAVAAIRSRSVGDPMLLALSLSSNDYVTHVFGPDSYEAWDNLRRLDQALAKLFVTLDGAVGADRWRLILTADHGGTPIPELVGPDANRAWCKGKDRWNRPCEKSVRLYVHELAKILEDAAIAALGPGHWIDGVGDPLVFYTEPAHQLEPARRKKLDEVVVSTLKGIDGIAVVEAVRTLPAVCPPHTDQSPQALICRSVPPTGPGDVYFATRPGSFVDTRYAVGKGQNHGSPWLFDRTVPLLIRAPGFVDANKVVDQPLSFQTTTEALEALLGIPKQELCCGEDLTHAPKK